MFLIVKMIYIGAHIKKEKTLLDTIKLIQENGGNALQTFVSNPRSAALVNIENYLKISNEIKSYCKEHNFKLIIHAPYTINMAKELKCGKRTIELSNCYWIELLLHELRISDLLGAVGVIVHVGKHTTLSYQEGIENMRTVIKYVVQNMRTSKTTSKLILETPAGQGTELLKNLTEFVEFYKSFSKEERDCLGICMDTAHVWSLGYELDEAYRLLGKNNVVAIHYNNSKKGKGAMVDQHEYLFDGKIPLESMKHFLNQLNGDKPVIILETPGTNLNKEMNWISANMK